MFNLAGTAFDFGNVIFAVLQECEHRRRGFSDETLQADLMNCASEKLAMIRDAYFEAEGSKGYWTLLEREILQTVMPQYVRQAAQQNRLERNRYDAWRGGDIASRAVMAVGGLAVGWLMWKAPFTPIWIDWFGLVLGGAGWTYPDINRLMHDSRHMKFLNRLVTEGQEYQSSLKTRYMTSAALDAALALEAETSAASPASAPRRVPQTAKEG